MRRFWHIGEVPPLAAAHQQRLNDWIGMLDVDLELAQRMLRLAPGQLPPLPDAPPPAVLRGAYASRAAAAAR